MSRKINHFIAELVAEDLILMKKMKKAELFDVASKAIERNYRDMCDETIIEIYEETFHTYVR